MELNTIKFLNFKYFLELFCVFFTIYLYFKKTRVYLVNDLSRVDYKVFYRLNNSGNLYFRDQGGEMLYARCVGLALRT